MIVVDASVAYKWFAEEELHGEAMALLHAQRPLLCAPELIVVEVANIAWKNALRGIIPSDQARTAVRQLPGYLEHFYRDREMIQRGFELAVELSHPVYDCVYLACLERSDNLLVTADQRLMKIVAKSAFADRVHHLASLPASLISA